MTPNTKQQNEYLNELESQVSDAVNASQEIFNSVMEILKNVISEKDTEIEKARREGFEDGKEYISLIDFSSLTEPGEAERLEELEKQYIRI